MSDARIDECLAHPLVRAHLSDLDAALGAAGVHDPDEIKRSVRVRLASAVARADDDSPVDSVVREALDQLGPVEAIANGLIDANAARQAHAESAAQRLTRWTIVATTLSVILVPIAAGISAIVSAVALVVATKWVSPRARTPLIVVNALGLLIVLAFLIAALASFDALRAPVRGGG